MQQSNTATKSISESGVYILYTEEEGGDFRYVAKHSDEETLKLYEETVKSGILIYQIGDQIFKIRPAYIRLAGTIRDFDFVLGRSRHDHPTNKERRGDE